jgi:hypothetical protein
MEGKMSKNTWKDADHHIMPKEIQRELFGTIVNDTTIEVTGAEHVQLHRDISEIGAFAALARHEARKAQGD